MDSGEARTVLNTYLESYRRRSYGELVALLGSRKVAELRDLPEPATRAARGSP